MKIAGIYGSPHKNGQSASIIAKLLRGITAEEKKEIFLDGLSINPCKGCFSCKKNNSLCVQKDEMREVYEIINESDLLIIGTPIYMWQMTGQTKVFTDRLMPYFRNGKKNGKRLILVYTYKSMNPEVIKEYFDYNKRMYEHLGFDVVGEIRVGKTDVNPVETRTDIAEMIDTIIQAI